MTSSIQSSRAGYTLRVPIRTLGEMPITGLDGADPINVDGLKIQIRSAPPLLVITVAGFANYGAAVAFLPRVIAGLWGLVVRWNIAFRADFTPQAVTYAEDPESAGDNLARAFGQASGPAVDGIAGAADVVAYPSDARLRWLGVGEARAIVQTPSTMALPAFSQVVANATAAGLVNDEKFKTAIELFNAYFYETSLRAKFLALIMILEVLAPVTLKHAAAQTALAEWKDRLRVTIAETTDADARSALESLDRELDFRRETSIRQRVRLLIRDEFVALDATSRTALEKQAVLAYDARGTLMHTGNLPAAELDAHHEQASRIVRRLLAQRLGVSL